MLHTDQMNAWVNDLYRFKLDAVAKARDAGDYYIWLHERPYRVYALQRIASMRCNASRSSSWLLTIGVGLAGLAGQ